jgi:hypothetical protein
MGTTDKSWILFLYTLQLTSPLLTLKSMPGRAKSAEKKAQICCEEEDLLMERAVAMYHAEQAKEVAQTKRKSLRAVCREMESGHMKATGREVHLDHGTLNRLYKGGQRLTDFNASKSWLLEGEVEKIIEYALSMAERGFPLSHKRLKEHVDDTCHARLGDDFPAAGVGANWTERFITKHSKQLTMYTPRLLDSKRAHAINPTTHAAWFKLLGETLKSGDDGKPIAQECCWGVDESGFQSGLGATGEKAIGGTGKSLSISKVTQHGRISLSWLPLERMAHHCLLLLFSKARHTNQNGIKITQPMLRKLFSH